jgi:hypothetical protein
MAVFTRVNGDAYGVNNTGAPTKLNANASPVVTGVANPINFLVVEVGGNLAAQLGSGGAVESIINSISSNATVLAYQVDATIHAGGLGSQLSVLVERSAWTSNLAVQSVIAAAGTVNGLALTSGSVVRVYAHGGFSLRRDPAAAVQPTGASHTFANI